MPRSAEGESRARASERRARENAFDRPGDHVEEATRGERRCECSSEIALRELQPLFAPSVARCATHAEHWGNNRAMQVHSDRSEIRVMHLRCEARHARSRLYKARRKSCKIVRARRARGLSVPLPTRWHAACTTALAAGPASSEAFPFSRPRWAECWARCTIPAAPLRATAILSD